MLPIGFKHSEKTKQKMSNSHKEYYQTHIPFMFGKYPSIETKEKMHLAHIGKKYSEKSKEKMRISRLKNLPKHRVVWTKEYKKQNLKEWRHKKGINKKYINDIRVPRKVYNQRYKALKKAGGELPIKRKYGTLTCYLCEKPILFGKDHLEHKTPLSREGTNRYNNLGIACQRCNCRKSAKTEEEFRKELR